MVFLRNASLALLVFALLLSSAVHAADSKTADSKSCDVYADLNGIPHARAADEVGAFRCQGYLHGRDRAWQMDYFRRLTQGRVSEILGASAVKTDFKMRIFDFDGQAKKLYAGLSPESRALLEAYTEGVNRGMDEALAQGVYEFKKFGYRPERWEAYQTIAMIVLQSFDQTRRAFEERIHEAERRDRYGKEAIPLFSEDGTPWDTSILKPGEYIPLAHEQHARKQDRSEWNPELARWIAELPEASAGSNNWAVAGSRSTTGHALLANDPHLNLKTPSFWYYSEVTGGSTDVIGASVPGIPLVVSGASRNLAWGLTNGYMDVADLFYRDAKELAKATSFRPWIWVKFWKLKLPMFFKTFHKTPEGWPILPLKTPAGKIMVLRWSGFDLRPSYFESFLGLMRAKTLDEVDSLLGKTEIPSWNFVFADNRGQIGFRTTGNPPARGRDIPYGIASDTSDWRTMTPEEMPHVLRPKRGYVATANNRQWPADAQSWAGRIFRMGMRANRIEELITSKRKHDIESMRDIQCDVQAVDARYLLPLLLKHLKKNGADLNDSPQRNAIEVLEKWDYSTRLDCKPCGVFRAWVNTILQDYGLDERALYHFLTLPTPPEDFRAGVKTAFLAALDQTGFRSTGIFRSWGEIHKTRFPHFAGPDEFRAPFISIPGDEHSVDVSTSVWSPEDEIFVGESGPSHRLLVELSSPPEVFLALPGLERDEFPIQTRDPSGPWMRWSQCQFRRADFPLDWSKVQPDHVTF